MNKNVISKENHFKRILSTLLSFLLVGCLVSCKKDGTVSNDLSIDDIVFTSGELNSELNDVIVYARRYAGFGKPQTIVAIKENGDMVDILDLREDTSERVFLVFGSNRLFFAYEEDDCIGYIDLTKGNGNYQFTVLKENLSFDRITGLAVAGKRLFYAYRDELEQTNTLKAIDIVAGQIEEDYPLETITLNANIRIGNFDDDTIVVRSSESIDLVDVKTQETTNLIKEPAEIQYSADGRLIYCKYPTADDDDYEYNEEWIPLNSCYIYQRKPEEIIREFTLPATLYEDKRITVIPYQSGYILGDGSYGNKVYYVKDGQLSVLLDPDKMKFDDDYSIDLIAKEVLSIRIHAHFVNLVANYNYDLATKKKTKQAESYNYYDAFYIVD